MKKIIVIMGLLLAANVGAQQLIQSRFIATNEGLANCSSCVQDEDGIAHFRFNLATVPIVTRNVEGSETRRLVFDVQARVLGPSVSQPYSAALFRLDYNGSAFGELTNPPLLTIRGEEGEGAKCSITSSLFPITSSGGISGYIRSASNTAASPSQSQLTVNFRSAAATDFLAGIDAFSRLTNEFQSYMTMECTIDDDNMDAGFSFSGTNASGNSVSREDSVRGTVGRSIFIVADNDLRGLRLDGKTWAEDYLRHGDGSGVRLRFSKGIATQLDSDNFSLDVSTQTSISVEHESGSPNVDITFDDVVENDILRIANTSTNVITDEAGDTLALGNFVASLFYDEGAPRVETTPTSSGNDYTITFSGPVASNTITADNLCVAEPDGLCAAEGETTTIPITDATAEGTTATEMTLTIDGSAGAKLGAQRSILFRRNAVLGPDLRIVEDYQEALQDVINIEDTVGAEITITRISDTREMRDAGSFTIQFRVQSDEPVPNLDNPNAYSVTIDNIMGSSTVTTAMISSATTDSPNPTLDTDVTFSYTVNFINNEESIRDIRSYTLNIVDGALLDSSGNPPSRINGVAPNDFDGVVERLSALSCAFFYPNIGQQTLYFQLDPSVTNFNGTLMIDGEMVEANNISPSISRRFSVNLGEEITSDMTMVAVFTNTDGEENRAECIPSLTENSDEDAFPDIVDVSPFVTGSTDRNEAIAGGDERATVPSEINEYYSRDTVIRSLIGEGGFTYVEDGVSSKQTFSRISSNDYFGIDANVNTQIFRIENGSECADVLQAALDNNLIDVSINEFCQNVGANNFANESANIAPQRYIWVDVIDGILQTPSAYFDYMLRILPEINFSGQPSYIFTEATTKTVIISTYRGMGRDGMLLPEIPPVNVRVRPSDDNQVVSLTADANQSGIARSIYNIASHDAGHPEPGETIVHWLAGDTESTLQIWAPTSDTTSVLEGGRALSGFSYAIGSNNNIDVRVADPDDPEITRIRQIVLYDIDESEIVSSVIAGGSYYVIADYDTNRPDEIQIATDPMEVSGYTDTETSATQFAMRTGSISFIGEYQTAIEISEIVAPTTGTGTITVGWRNIGNIEDIQAIYQVTPLTPRTYSVVDASGSLFSGNNFTQTNALPVLTSDGMMSRGLRNVDSLRAHDGDEQNPLPVFFTHLALINAGAEGGSAADYSAANIAVDEDTLENTLGLEMLSENEEIRSIATFGVSNVEYGFTTDNDEIEIAGGVIYVTFPITAAVMDRGATLYVGKYDTSNDSPSWYNFERDAAGNTWYAVERTDVSIACPTDLQFYINNHQPAGDDGMGFEASADNCIMLVITDGSIYDASSRDGIIIDPVGISARLLDALRADVTPGRRGGGGGAIGTSDALLLIGALVLLLIATANRRRRKLNNL